MGGPGHWPLRYTAAAQTIPAHIMAGLTPNTPQPTSITAHQQSRVLEVGFSDGTLFRIPFELMRVYSPSADVQSGDGSTSFPL